jgi:hypothetical protein
LRGGLVGIVVAYAFFAAVWIMHFVTVVGLAVIRLLVEKIMWLRGSLIRMLV